MLVIALSSTVGLRRDRERIGGYVGHVPGTPRSRVGLRHELDDVEDVGREILDALNSTVGLRQVGVEAVEAIVIREVLELS